MTPISKSLEEKITTLISQMAVTNASLVEMGQTLKQHDQVIYGKDPDGGLVTSRNVIIKTIEEHDVALQRLETNCNKITGFMESQIEINKSQADSLKLVNRVVILLATAVFLILLLIGVADLHVLESILSGLHVFSFLAL